MKRALVFAASVLLASCGGNQKQSTQQVPPQPRPETVAVAEAQNPLTTPVPRGNTAPPQPQPQPNTTPTPGTEAEVRPTPPPELKRTGTGADAYNRFPEPLRSQLIKEWEQETEAVRRAIREDEERLRVATSEADRQKYTAYITRYKARLQDLARNDPPYIGPSGTGKVGTGTGAHAYDHLPEPWRSKFVRDWEMEGEKARRAVAAAKNAEDDAAGDVTVAQKNLADAKEDLGEANKAYQKQARTNLERFQKAKREVAKAERALAAARSALAKAKEKAAEQSRLATVVGRNEPAFYASADEKAQAEVAALPPEAQKQIRDAAAQAKENPATLEKFAAIRPGSGMRYEDVEKIMGVPGTPVSEDIVGDSTYTVYKWANRKGGAIIVTFKNRYLRSKEQIGLR